MFERAINKKYHIYLYIAFVTYLLSLITSPIAQIVCHDREVFRYIGMLLSKGYVPYVHVFELRMPLIFLAAAVGLNLGAWWGYWLVLTTVLMISAIALFRLFKYFNLPYAFSCVLVYIIYMQWSPMAEGASSGSYNLSASLVTIFLCVCFVTRSLLLLGIVAALIFCTQTNDILSLLPLLVYKSFWDPDLKKVNLFAVSIKKILTIAAGFVVVLVMVCSFFVYHNAFAAMLDDALLFPFMHYMPHHSHNALLFIKNWIFTGSQILFIALMFNVFYCCCRTTSMYKDRPVILITGCSIVLQFVSASLSGKFYWHYYLAYTPYLILQVGFFLKNNTVALLKKGYITLLAATVALFGLYGFYKASHYYKLLASRQGFHITTPYRGQVNPYIELLTNTSKQYGPLLDKQLFIYRNVQLFSLYTELRVIAPTKWLEPDFLTDYGFDQGGDKFASIVHDIKNNRTRYILDFSSNETNGSLRNEILWKQLLRDYYIKKSPLPCLITQLTDKPSKATCGWLYVRK